MVMLGNDTKELQNLITKLGEGTNEYGIKINIEKTKSYGKGMKNTTGWEVQRFEYYVNRWKVYLSTVEGERGRESKKLKLIGDVKV